MPKALWTNNSKENSKAVVTEVGDGNQEARYVVSQIKRLRDNNKYDYDDFVILYRTNSQSRYFEDALRRASIPYKTVGGISFYARAEIKDLIAYLSLINNEKDDLSFLRIINQPKRQLGAASLEKLTQFAEFKGWSLYETVKNIEEVPTLTKKVKDRFISFRNIIEELKEDAKEDTLPELIEKIYVKTGYSDLLSSDKTDNGETKMENVDELINAAQQHIMEQEDKSINGFLENSSLSSSVDEVSDEKQVNLMTLHSAKGLEFPVVFLVGMEDDLFPSFRANESGDIEEERRLCYVGITRAQEKLFLTFADRRMMRGQTYMQYPSPFIDELPEQYVQFNTVDRSKDKRITFTSEATSDLYKTQEVSTSTQKQSGDKVYHKVFGKGTVIQVDKGLLTIAFPGVGIKKIDESFVTLI